MAVIWSSRSRNDLADILRYIARDNRDAAERWVLRLIQQAESAAEAPYKGRIVPEFRREQFREVFLKSYRIVYRLVGSDIEVMTVVEGHKRLRPSDIDD